MITNLSGVPMNMEVVLHLVLYVKQLLCVFLFLGVESLHVPSTHIWLPDIVLYNK